MMCTLQAIVRFWPSNVIRTIKKAEPAKYHHQIPLGHKVEIKTKQSLAAMNVYNSIPDKKSIRFCFLSAQIQILIDLVLKREKNACQTEFVIE